MTPETEALGELLRKYPRRLISAFVQDATSLDELQHRLNGCEEKIEARNWAGKKPLSKHVGRLAGDRSERQHGTRLVGFYDHSFPELLRAIPDPPLILQVAGDLACLDYPTLAIVGARRCTSIGKALTERLAGEIAGAGLTIVSGLALGIDAAAHRGTLDGKARTVACLGSGFDSIYPRAHQGLAKEIIAMGGLLVSEYDSAQAARPYHFPERNRIISGLSLGVLVAEASERSGSLITARLALEQGRDVFALPGPVDSSVSAGCHRMIRDGAELVTKASQILASLGLDVSQQPVLKSSLSPDQTYLQALMAGYAHSFDELEQLTGWSFERLVSVLGELELLGIVRQSTDGYISI